MKLTKKQLRILINESIFKNKKLLRESMITALDLHPSVGIEAHIMPFRSHTVTFSYAGFDENNMAFESYSSSILPGPNGVYGIVSIMKLQEGEDCAGAFAITGHSSAAHGYGPLLYDVAIEYASMYGTGLVADRGRVSPAAQGVWSFYYSPRREDVIAFQCDDMSNSLTSDPRDNMNQMNAKSLTGGDFTASSISRRYSKKPASNIEYFKQINRWEEYT